ncbi:Mitochondrial import inner membrane translocase subunit Tim17/Tim22/Tim23 family protein [Zea mays]|uniref:Mitochondrial import inner membrane translocase subunit Tim17/Tim22/Tim23 family protein n=1 Tax=Zea mays TaxID=4577 RepID=A0A1D6H9K4_MAIZE|nr:Mitochondrial import inner membrane translocase subunit Tim17/Tim22/Tim23 family protein [Zea mays]
MADGKRGEDSAVALKTSPSSAVMAGGLRGVSNPLEEWSGRVKAIEAGFRAWMAKQPIQIEAAVTTAVGAVQGGALGGLMGSLTADGGSPFPIPQPPPNANPEAMASFKQAQALAGGPLVQARNFAVMTGANAGISCVMRRIRGKEDIQGRWGMAAAFGSGALFSIVSGMGTPNPVANAVTTGVAFAVFQGGFFMFIAISSLREIELETGMLSYLWKIGQKFSKPPSEDTYYSRTRSMLHKLGLEKYEKNFKRGLLNDQTLPLLTDSALRDVKIPPGPRLLILDQIKRDPELVQAK